MLSAVPNQVNQNLAAAGQMNLQQQQINNQAAAQKQQLDLQRQQMQQERMLSEDALRQRTMESLLQAENYEKLNASNLQIARERNMQAEATRRQSAQLAQADRDMQMQMHNKTMAADKEAKALQIQIALAQAEGATPEQQAQLEAAEARLVDFGIRMDAANRLESGQIRDINEHRQTAVRAMKETVENVDTAFDRLTVNLPEEVAAIDYVKYFGTPYEGFFSSLGSSVGEVGGAIANTFLPESLEFAGQTDSRALLTLINDPDASRAANLQYHSDLVKKGLESLFPNATNPGDIAASWMGLSGAIEGYTEERKEAAVQQFLGEIQAAGVDPLMFGEMMRRIDKATEGRLSELRVQGISPNMPSIEANQSGEFIQSHLLRTTAGHRVAVALLPSLNPMRSYLDTLEDPGVNIDMIREMVAGMGDRGITPGPEIDQLLEAMGGLESTRTGKLDIERDIGLEETGLDTMTRGIEMDISRRQRDRLEEIAQGLLGG